MTNAFPQGPELVSDRPTLPSVVWSCSLFVMSWRRLPPPIETIHAGYWKICSDAAIS